MPLQPTGRMPGTPNAIITSPMIVSAPHPPAASAVAAAAGGNLQYPVAAPRSSRSAAAAAAAAAVAAGGGGVPRSKVPLGAAAGGFRHGSPGKLLHPLGQRMQFYPNLSGSETDVSTSTENLTQVSKANSGGVLVFISINQVLPCIASPQDSPVPERDM